MMALGIEVFMSSGDLSKMMIFLKPRPLEFGTESHWLVYHLKTTYLHTGFGGVVGNVWDL